MIAAQILETQLLIDILVLSLLAATAVTIVRMRELWAAVMLTGIFSFLGASWMVILDAPDVAFTEAAVGAGISTFLMLATLALTNRKAKRTEKIPIVPFLVVVATGVVLVIGTFDMPRFGDPNAPIHRHVTPEYLHESVPHVDREENDVHIPNIVTVVLASYRGYDTLGETAVIFTAGIGVLILLRGRRDRAARESNER